MTLSRLLRPAGVVLAGAIVLAWVFVSCDRSPATNDEAKQALEHLRSVSPAKRAAAARKLGELKYRAAVAPLARVLMDSDSEVRVDAIAALGQIGGPEAIEPLCRTVRQPEWRERQAAAEALGRIKAPAAVDPLIALLDDRYAAVAETAAQALIAIAAPSVEPLRKLVATTGRGYERGVYVLGELGDAASVPAIRPLLKQPPTTRGTAAEALGKLGDAASAETLVAMLGVTDAASSQSVQKALLRLGPGAMPAMVTGLSGTDVKRRLAVVDILAKSDAPSVVVPLLTALNDKESSVRDRAMAALTPRLASNETLTQFISALGDAQPAVRLRACDLIGRTGQVFPVEPVQARLADTDAQVRAAAARLLAKLGDKGVVESLVPLLADPEARVRLAAADALSLLGDRRAGDPLLDIVKSASPPAADLVTAVVGLGRVADARAAEPLLALLAGVSRSTDSALLPALIESLGQVGDRRATEPLLAMLGGRCRFEIVRALGRLRDPKAFAPLESIMVANNYRRDYGLRMAAVEAMVAIDPVRSVPVLVEHLQTRVMAVDNGQYEHLCKVFAGLRDPRTIRPLVDLLGSEAIETRLLAARALREVGAAHVAQLIEAMKDVSAGHRSGVAVVLAEIGKPATQPVLESLKSPVAEIRQGAAWALGEMRDPAHAPALVTLLADQHLEVRAAAAWAIGTVRHEPSMDAVAALLKDPQAKPRQAAVAALGLMGGPKAIAAITSALADAEPTVRVESLRALWRAESPGIRASAQAALKDVDPAVRAIAVEIIKSLDAKRTPKPR